VVEVVELRTMKGFLCFIADEHDEAEKWFLADTIEWNGVEADVQARLNDLLEDFDEKYVEITIKVVEKQ